MEKYTYSVLYILTTAISFVLIEKMASILSPALSLLISSSVATLFFHLLNINSLKILYKKVWEERYNWFMSNLTLAITWLCTFYGAKYLGAFVILFIFFMSSAIISYFVLMVSKKIFLYQFISVTGCLILLILVIYWKCASQKNNEVYFGVFLGIIGGFASYLYRKLSYTLSAHCKLTTTQILAVRNFGIILIGTIVSSKASFALLNYKSFSYAFLIAFISFIIPVYFNQKGITHVGPEQHSIIVANCPFATYFLDAVVNNSWSYRYLVCSIIGGILLTFSNLKSGYKARSK